MSTQLKEALVAAIAARDLLQAEAKKALLERLKSEGVVLGEEMNLEFGTGLIEGVEVEDVLSTSTTAGITIYYYILGRKRLATGHLGALTRVRPRVPLPGGREGVYSLPALYHVDFRALQPA